jgi:DNA-binding phage protein
MKSRPSKLDQFAAQLADLDAEKKTLPEICEWLASEGCRVSPSSVSVYLERLRSARREAAILSQITNGARQSADVEKQFSKNPAPQLDTIIKLHRVMIMQLATQSVDNPELIQITNNLTKTVMDFVSGQTKAEIEKQKLSQGERKIAILEKKAAQLDQVKGVVESQLSPEEQKQRLKEILK